MSTTVSHVYYRPTPRLQEWKSSVARPADFDRFWAATFAAADKTPLDPRLTPVPLRSTLEVEVFEARYNSYGGLEIAGWYCRPRNRNGKVPGMLFVPGYVSEPLLPMSLAMMGYATFSAAPRGKLRSNSVFNPGYPGLLTHNIHDRDDYGYRGFYVDAVRAFDFLAGLPEVDASRTGVQGGSQGGALTLLVASVRAGKVAAASAGAPYLCSMMDAASLTRSYPYEEINDYMRLYPERKEKARATLDYYDIHNFAGKITCPIIVNIGLRDDVCPPETGFALFDAIGSKDKRLYTYENCGHDSGSGAGHGEIVNRFFAERLLPQPVKRTATAARGA
jgi:cephalosporin-C deacetylase